MEDLQRLTRKQLEALQGVASLSTSTKGVALQALARRLRVSSPTALAHLTVLENHGLISRDRGKTRVTRRGSRTLEEYVRHHRVAETLFSEAGLSAAEACVAAREVDLAISHRVVEKIWEAERHPTQCPHGLPIDSRDIP